MDTYFVFMKSFGPSMNTFGTVRVRPISGRTFLIMWLSTLHDHGYF